MNVARIKGTLKVLPIYVCSLCQRHAHGSTMRIEIDGYTASDLPDIIRNEELTSAYMPIGWSYCGNFKCNNHH